MINGVVIVETRPNVGLRAVVGNCMKYLDRNWMPFVFCSEKNKHEVYNEAKYILQSDSLNESQYNRMLTSSLFWNLLPFDKVLITQTDAAMLRSGIEEFMGWDYCGAPWTFAHHGGNGGFSLRTVKSMKDVCDEFRYDPSMGNEDVFYSNILKAYPKYGKLAPREVNEKFSCESIFKLGTLGVHAIDKHLTKGQCETILNQYK